MEVEYRREKRNKWWATALMAVFLVAVMLGIRHVLAGWLLPDGRFLEALVEKVQCEELLTEAVFSNLQELFGND